MNQYTLPDLNYKYDALKPFLSEEQLKIHHDKHHKAYVDGANTILDSLVKARKDKADVDQKSTLKSLSFNAAGHLLHSIFWNNMTPKKNEPSKEFLTIIEDEFGSFDRFKQEFTKAAVTTEGSGWAALVYCKQTKRPMLMQIEKHNVNVIPMFTILLVLDVWEHAYYIDYKNDRAKYVENFWNVVDWAEVGRRMKTCF